MFTHSSEGDTRKHSQLELRGGTAMETQTRFYFYFLKSFNSIQVRPLRIEANLRAKTKSTVRLKAKTPRLKKNFIIPQLFRSPPRTTQIAKGVWTELSIPVSLQSRWT